MLMVFQRSSSESSAKRRGLMLGSSRRQTSGKFGEPPTQKMKYMLKVQVT